MVVCIRFAAFAAIVVVLAGTGTESARASETNAPPGNSGVNQYLEVVPSPSGPKTPPTSGDSRKLPARIQDALAEQGSEGVTLARIAATTAPEPALRAGSTPTSSGRGAASQSNIAIAATPAEASPSALSDAANVLAIDPDTGGMGPLLPIVLLASVAGGVVILLLRRRHGE